VSVGAESGLVSAGGKFQIQNSNTTKKIQNPKIQYEIALRPGVSANLILGWKAGASKG